MSNSAIKKINSNIRDESIVLKINLKFSLKFPILEFRRAKSWIQKLPKKKRKKKNPQIYESGLNSR